MTAHEELDKLLDEIKDTADRFTLFYPNIKSDHISGLMGTIRDRDLSKPIMFVLKNSWTDYGNGLKGRIVDDISDNRYVVTAWKTYKTVCCPPHLHLEDKTLYIISGRIEDPKTGEVLADGKGYIEIPAGQKHNLKILAGTVFVTTFHPSELTGEKVQKLIG